MTSLDRESHWENIYTTKALTEVSWYQPVPQTSLDAIQALNPSLDDAIIDIGGGDSFLVDHLLDLGFTNISVLDISSKAIDRAKERLGNKAGLVKWIVSDVTSFKPTGTYKIWHDRAAFHFLTEPKDIVAYSNLVENSIESKGHFILGTFSTNGPTKCSGINIQQYSCASAKAVFQSHFDQIKCELFDHETPFDTTQNFIFSTFKRKN